MKKRQRSGFTLVEVMIDAFVITLVFGALSASFILVLQTVNAGKVRSAASTLANEQMETLRNLPYDSLSTANGPILPQGTIPDTQTITRSGVSYVLTTRIIIIDNPFDGCAIPLGGGQYQCTDGGTSTTQDLVPVDYKRISLEVAQSGKGLILARLSSDAAAKAAETPSNTGMLLVIVNNALGLPVEGATVTVTNVDLNPDVSLQGFTNALGYFFVANLPPDTHNHYHIVATKSGYSQDFTTDRTSQNPNQTQPDVSINIQQLTTQTLVIDWLGGMTVTAKNEQGQPLANLSLTLTSNKITQNNPETAKNVYTMTTDSNGIATFTNIEWDSYDLTAPSSYYVVTTSPYQPVAVAPSNNTATTLVLTTNNSWPRLTSISPAAGTNTAPVTVSFEGNNFASGSTVLLRQTGQADILPTGAPTVAANGKNITATFDLTGKAIGSWDIIITSSGQSLTQVGGFIIS